MNLVLYKQRINTSTHISRKQNTDRSAFLRLFGSKRHPSGMSSGRFYKAKRLKGLDA